MNPYYLIPPFKEKLRQISQWLLGYLQVEATFMYSHEDGGMIEFNARSGLFIGRQGYSIVSNPKLVNQCYVLVNNKVAYKFTQDKKRSNIPHLGQLITRFNDLPEIPTTFLNHNY